jgi:type I restriction enzyme, S subunit
MNFALNQNINPDKVFIVPKSEVTGRLDPFFFRPELVTLEDRVSKVTTKRLRDFAVSVAGGATPSTNESETHYTESEEGIPFIRVQNLSTTGKLNLEDCKRITRGTHEGLLARSKLSGGELLVKITGVGRMAIASVVPQGFEGNINQHIVAIRTKDQRTSETLAAYLNLDLVERLASRRSAGATRPALDYPALLSIPIIFDDRIPELMHIAVERHQKQIEESTSLLNKIDDVLLEELGISQNQELPNTLESRMFLRTLTQITGSRFDAHYYKPEFQRLLSQLKIKAHVPLGQIVNLSSELWDQQSHFETVFPYVEIGSLDSVLGQLREPAIVPIAEAAGRARMLLRQGDLLVSLTRPTRRAICSVPKNRSLAVASTGFAVIRRFDETRVVRKYLFYVLRSKLCTAQFDQRSSGGNYPAITEEQFLKLTIPLPSIPEQNRIVEILDSLYVKAETMLANASTQLETAKLEIENLILGNGVSQ